MPVVALLGDDLSDARHIVTFVRCRRLTAYKLFIPNQKTQLFVSLATVENKIVLMIVAFMQEHFCCLSESR